VVARFEPRDQLVHERTTTKWLIAVGESIGKSLETMTVLRGREITLLEAVEFGF
jgi:hypothetical protein